MFDLSIFIFLTLVFVVISYFFGGVLSTISCLVAWLSFITSLEFGSYSDIQAAYMSILLWLMGLGLAIWYKLFPEKQINDLGALLLSYLPLVGVFFVMSTNKLAQYTGLLYILLILVLPYKRISQSFSPNTWNKVFILAMGLQITIVAIITRSLYVLSYVIVLWWWYELTVRRRAGENGNNSIAGG
jgi:hypothetical protein